MNRTALLIVGVPALVLAAGVGVALILTPWAIFPAIAGSFALQATLIRWRYGP